MTTAKMKKRRLTPEQFDRLPDTKGLELVNGRLDIKGTGGESSWLNVEWGATIREFVKANNLGHVFGSECTYQCYPKHPGTIRKPDVSFIRFGRLPGERIPKGNIQIAPDLVVEVISPRDRWYQVERKIDEYLEVQVPLVWVVNPDTRTVLVFTPDGTITRHRETAELSGDPVLPGFRILIRDLMPRLPETAG